MNTKAIGDIGESIALNYLQKLGYELLERNFRGKRGEIDIIMTKGVVIVFVEVKYRRQGSFGYSAYSITESKKKKLYKIAEEYLTEKHLCLERECSFSAVLIDDSALGRNISFVKDIFI